MKIKRIVAVVLTMAFALELGTGIRTPEGAEAKTSISTVTPVDMGDLTIGEKKTMSLSYKKKSAITRQLKFTTTAEEDVDYAITIKQTSGDDEVIYLTDAFFSESPEVYHYSDDWEGDGYTWDQSGKDDDYYKDVVIHRLSYDGTTKLYRPFYGRTFTKPNKTYYVFLGGVAESSASAKFEITVKKTARVQKTNTLKVRSKISMKKKFVDSCIKEFGELSICIIKSGICTPTTIKLTKYPKGGKSCIAIRNSKEFDGESYIYFKKKVKKGTYKLKVTAAANKYYTGVSKVVVIKIK